MNMKMCIRDIVSATGGEYHGDPAALNQVISSVTMDSRTAGKDCLFLAIPGQHVDGHDFLPDVAGKDAACALCQRPTQEMPCVVVPSTTEAVKALAAWYRRQFSIPVIGIVGSVGKTTAKEMVSNVLSQRFCVLKTEKNLNNELGVPLTLFRLREEHQVAVVEMGISDFGEMTRLAQMAQPTMVLFTVIGHSHLETLRDLAGVFQAKTEVLAALPADGVVFANGDDPWLRQLDCSQKKIYFGTGEVCQVQARMPERLCLEGMDCEIAVGDRHFAVHVSGFGLQMLTAAAEGAAVGLEFGLTETEIAAGIAAYVTVGFRSQVERADGITIVNDCYNANPDSTSMAVISLARLEGVGRKVCILGDMLELGDDSPNLHRELGAFAVAQGIDLILTCGDLGREIARGAGAHGRWYPNKAELQAALPNQICPRDMILVKASRGMHFEELVESLRRLEMGSR